MTEQPSDAALDEVQPWRDYVKKPLVVKARRWFSMEPTHAGFTRLVQNFCRPEDSGGLRCRHCDKRMDDHGWIKTLEGGHIVCPGDWIICGVAGEYYPCKPSIFDATYQLFAPSDEGTDS